MHDLLSTSERDQIIANCLREYLPPLGLTERQTRSWIDGSRAPIRRLFEIKLLKGASLKVNWGFSLDFVPHISGGRVRWHRTDKTAMLDVVIDPRDVHDASYLHGRAHLTEALHSLLPEVTHRAQKTWQMGSTFGGMLEIIREIRNKQTNVFAYQNYTQLPLAFAFLLAKTGDLQSAENELSKYSISFQLDEDESAKLMQLARQALEFS